MNMINKYGTLREFVLEKCNAYRDKTLFQYWGNDRNLVSITYNQLSKDIHALGTYLISQGYRNEHIAIISENSYDWIRLFFAISFTFEDMSFSSFCIFWARSVKKGREFCNKTKFSP